MAIDLSIASTLKDAVFAQINNTRHVVNRIQISWYNDKQWQDEILFFAEHSQTKQKNKKSIQHAKLFKISNGNGVNAPELLSYNKGMPIAILTNQCTSLRIVNRAQTILHGIVVSQNGR